MSCLRSGALVALVGLACVFASAAAQGAATERLSLTPVAAVTGAQMQRAQALLDARRPAVEPGAPAATGDAGPRKAQSVAQNLVALRQGEFGGVQPDTSASVGIAQVAVATEVRIRTFNKATGNADRALDVDPSTFFAAAMTPVGGGVASNTVGNVRVRYDVFWDRWVIIAADSPKAPNGDHLANQLMIAISGNGTLGEGTLWHFYVLTGSTSIDRLSLGMSDSAVLIALEEYALPQAQTMVDATAFALDKRSIFQGGVITGAQFSGLSVATQGPRSLQAVDEPATTCTTADNGKFIGPDRFTKGKLIYYRVTNLATNPTLSAAIPVTVAATSDPLPVPHAGNASGAAGYLDSGGDRFHQAMCVRDTIVAAHAILVDAAGNATTNPSIGRNGVRWYELGTLGGTPTVLQAGTLFDGTAGDPYTANIAWNFAATIAKSGQGHMVLGESYAGPQFPASAGLATRLAASPAGTIVFTPLASGTGSYNPPFDPSSPRRWGEASATVLDATDQQTVWTAQQYVDANNSWAVRLARVQAPPPATPISVTPSSLPAGAGYGAEQTLTITGTSSGGSGFFNPVSGRIIHPARVEIEGVQVVSTTVDSPTQVTVKVRTLGSTAGFKNIDIYNPDGQAVQLANALTVSSGGAPIITSGSSLICTVGAPCNFQATGFTGTNPQTWSVVGALPSGVNFSPSGAFSGAAAAGTQGTYALTMTLSNGVANQVQDFRLIVVTACGGFTDVPTSAVYCDASEWLRNRGVTVGCTSTTLYCPGDNVTRAQMALFMNRLGNALSPLVLRNHAAFSTQLGTPINLKSDPVLCNVNHVQPTNYPRVALVNWAVTARAPAPMLALVRAVASENYGGTWTSIDSATMRMGADTADTWVAASGSTARQIPAGAGLRFGVQALSDASRSGNPDELRCQLVVSIFSQTGTQSPFDEVPVGTVAP